MSKRENDEIRITPDALISLVVTEAEERELAAMPSLKEMNAQFHPSEQFQTKMDRLLKKVRRKEEWHQVWKPTKKILVAFTSVVTVLAFAFLPVKAVQDAVVDTIIQWRDGFMSIIYSVESENPPLNLPAQIELNYIPDGYTLISEDSSEQDRYMARLVADGDKWCTVRIVTIDSSQEIGIDNEFTEYYALEFDGHDAIWGIREDNRNTLLWEENGLSFMVYCNMDISEILKLAEGITIKTTRSAGT